MSLQTTITIEGAGKLGKKLEPRNLATPIRNILSRSMLLAERQVKQYTPVDTGNLRSSWTTFVDQAEVPTFAHMGTNVEYAATLEYSDKKPRGVGRIPFFEPAVKDVTPRIKEYLSEAVRLIEAEWGR